MRKLTKRAVSSKERANKSARSTSYQDYLINSLKDPKEAAGYLNAALKGGDMKVFILALQNVIQARGGVTEISEKTQKSRTSLYKTLSSKGNPYLKSINELMGAMDLHFAVVPNEKPKKSQGNEARSI